MRHDTNLQGWKRAIKAVLIQENAWCAPGPIFLGHQESFFYFAVEE